MDSKYALLGKNHVSLPKFNIKPKPTPVVFTGSGPPAKKMKLQDKENKSKNNTPAVSQQSLQDQRRALPIFGVRNRLLDEIKRHNTLIIIGETGSGKTTQIPQFIHSMRLQNDKAIGITQPRRVAAVTIALRVSQEMGVTCGETVGYTVRFEDASSRKTKIKYLTDGMLLREAMGDNLLLHYNVLILDEAHERTIATDVLFGIVKEAQSLRKDRNLSALKLIIMSATMDVDHFSKYFNNCKTVYIEGRTYPVDVYHTMKSQEDYQFSCLVTLFKIHKEAPANHDVLIFLTGQEEIEAMLSMIYQIGRDPELSGRPALKVYPLYAGLPSDQQLDVFKPTPPNIRKVILSTNVAETSITINGIRFVIDSGMVKSKSYRPSTGLDCLKVHKISQAQAWQRTGRAGRNAKGICYRMFTKDELKNMPKVTKPEILRCNLNSVSLQLLSMEIEANKFDFMDKPSKESVDKAFYELKLLGAIECTNGVKLTSLGKKMAQFPVDPHFSKILISSKDYGCMEEILSIISVLSSETIFVTPSSKRDQAIAARQKFCSPFGDHITMLNIYRAFNNAAQKKHWCFENFLNFRSLSYAKEVRTQLADLCQRCDISLSSCGSNMEQVRKCLVSGFFMNVAETCRNNIKGTHLVTLDSHQVVQIHPNSVLHGMKPHCVIFTEIVQTSNCYLRTLSTIEPDWLREIAPEYMKTHSLTASNRSN